MTSEQNQSSSSEGVGASKSSNSPSESWDHFISDRFSVEINAKPSAAKSELPLVYVNQGQIYEVSVLDKFASKNNKIQVTFILSFCKDEHRKISSELWNTWFSFQEISPGSYRPLSLSPSNEGVVLLQSDSPVESGLFIDTSMSVQVKDNSKMLIRISFDCLSSDFSRSKGSRGVPLKLDVIVTDQSNDGAIMSEHLLALQSFKDKGADRKYRDDQRRNAKKGVELNADEYKTKLKRVKVLNIDNEKCNEYLRVLKRKSEFMLTGSCGLQSSVPFGSSVMRALPEFNIELAGNFGSLSETGTSSTRDCSSTVFLKPIWYPTGIVNRALMPHNHVSRGMVTYGFPIIVSPDNFAANLKATLELDQKAAVLVINELGITFDEIDAGNYFDQNLSYIYEVHHVDRAADIFADIFASERKYTHAVLIAVEK